MDRPVIETMPPRLQDSDRKLKLTYVTFYSYLTENKIMKR